MTQRITEFTQFEQTRANFVSLISVVTLFIALIGVFGRIFDPTSEGLSTDILLPIVLGGVAIYALWLARQGQVYRAAYWVIGALLILQIGVRDQPSIAFLIGIFVLIAGAVLLNTWMLVGATAIVLANQTYQIINILNANDMTLTGESGRLIVETVTLVIAVLTVRFFVTAASRTADESHRNAELLQATAEVGQITATLLDLNSLFKQAVTLIRERFNYYHVQVFLVDEARKYANLVSSTGDVGQQLLNRGHRLAVGSQSVIGQVTLRGEPVVALSDDTQSIHARNELLPSTRTELALPILDGERIIGALDVQSIRANAFDDTDIQALQVMANQLAVAIRNARLFEAQEASVEENKRLVAAAQQNVREIERLNRQLSGEAWQEYLQARPQTTGVTLKGDAVETQADWTAAMREASQTQKPVIAADRQRVAVPILLRERSIGVIEVVLPKAMQDSDIVQIVEAVTRRLAISLENVRLYEEAQETSAQEQRINEIVGRYQSANTVDDLLQITLKELTQTFGAETGMIRLAKSSDRSNGHHGEQIE